MQEGLAKPAPVAYLRAACTRCPVGFPTCLSCCFVTRPLATAKLFNLSNDSCNLGWPILEVTLKYLSGPPNNISLTRGFDLSDCEVNIHIYLYSVHCPTHWRCSTRTCTAHPLGLRVSCCCSITMFMSAALVFSSRGKGLTPIRCWRNM